MTVEIRPVEFTSAEIEADFFQAPPLALWTVGHQTMQAKLLLLPPCCHPAATLLPASPLLAFLFQTTKAKDTEREREREVERESFF